MEVVYTNGEILQTFPVPEGPEWRVATGEDVARIQGVQDELRLAAFEAEWAAAELRVIARQLEAIEEDEAGVLPEDLLPGTRVQWLAYRGMVRNWKEGAAGFPEIEQRPSRPE